MQNTLYKHTAAAEVTSRSGRITSIDALRGLIIILMALDHVRDFWSATPYRADDVSQASIALFMTRWITHFCAPIFVFLTGVSILLYKQQQGDLRTASIFLLKRGAWMIFLELAVVGFFWQFSYDVIFIQVIWVIGWSMLCMAGLIWLPRWLLTSLTVILIAGHQLLIYIEPKQVTVENLGWIFLHRPVQFLPLSEGLPPLFAAYPLIPWVAVMIAGYLAGSLFTLAPDLRKRRLFIMGFALIIFYILLRASNMYGDPNPWVIQQKGILYTLLSFISISKYPPSLLYLSITLGGACLLLALFENVRGRVIDFFLVFGKVPLFFYLLHIPLINASAMLWMSVKFGYSVNLFFSSKEDWPSAYEPNLVRAYFVWAVLIATLYFACRWYGKFKQSHSYWWLKYL
ncbi:DUF1624 domain-containing protein [Dyadobacter frigoris]|uniref:DUF1624 domain-containing protein n=1 Tax=Dyadobacter frigoris TaxID=2576211 RepID=A0A4U6DFQ0_9BACT|nr:heparan-alpha-glucosaminide N-acetyltransferase domain-containing protein [Dyadobacter frigoris]TKT93414.1 DUF1624 domain-containing protein [Dyadobacter frigoris]